MGEYAHQETYTAALRSFVNSERGATSRLTNSIQIPSRHMRLSCVRMDWFLTQYLSTCAYSGALYNRAVEAGITQQQKPFRHVYTGIDKTVKRALPISKKYDNCAILSYLNLLHSHMPAIFFMLSFYLRGMSFIDMAFLRKTALHNNRITYRRHKTGQQLTIACTPEMKTILNRYPGNASDYLLPIIPLHVTDERKAYRNQSYSINRRLKQIAVMLDITTPLSHCIFARHSWASAAKRQWNPYQHNKSGDGGTTPKPPHRFICPPSTHL